MYLRNLAFSVQSENPIFACGRLKPKLILNFLGVLPLSSPPIVIVRVPSHL
jgi:hypothetical protein